MSLMREIKRRNVHRVALGYLAFAWLLVQIADTLLPIFDLSNGVARALVVVLAIGFIPALAISWVFQLTSEGLVRDLGAESDQATRVTSSRTLDRAIVIVLTVAIAYFAIDKFVISPQRETTLIKAATQAGAEQALEEESRKAPAIPDESVAVLPFMNMSGDPENEYFSDGLTETLLHMLAQLSDLKVAARTSVFAFKGQNLDIRDIGLKLGVAHVLEGSVQKSGDQFRVTAQLVRATDGFHAWSKNYDRTLEDIFAIQDAIATDVAIALGSSLLGEQRILGVFTGDASAYDIYLQGLKQQATGTVESLEAAERLFNAALRIDPEFLDAELALVRNYHAQHHKDVLGNVPVNPHAAELIAKVLARQPDNLVARQYDLFLRADSAYASLNPVLGNQLIRELLLTFDEGFGEPYIRQFVAMNLAGSNEFDVALDLLRMGLLIDPLNVNLLKAQSQVLQRADRLGDALLPLATAMQIQPENAELHLRAGYLEMRQNNPAEALDYYRQAAEVDTEDPWPALLIARLLNNLGMFEQAERWIDIHRSRAGFEGDIMNLRAWAARRRGHAESLRSLVPATLERVLTGELADQYSTTNFCVLLVHYSILMVEDNRPQEAIDYLESYYPGASNLSVEVSLSSPEMFMVQQCAMGFLLPEVTDRDNLKEIFRSYNDGLAERGYTFVNERPIWVVSSTLFIEGIEPAKIAFDEHFGEGTSLVGDWVWIIHVPALAEFRKEPEIAAAIAAREKRLAAIREEVLEMLRKPEWQIYKMLTN